MRTVGEKWLGKRTKPIIMIFVNDMSVLCQEKLLIVDKFSKK